MNFSFLSPVQDLVLAHNALLSIQVLGRKLKIHSKQFGIPDLDDVKIAIVGVLENRNDIAYIVQRSVTEILRLTMVLPIPSVNCGLFFSVRADKTHPYMAFRSNFQEAA